MSPTANQTTPGIESLLDRFIKASVQSQRQVLTEQGTRLWNELVHLGDQIVKRGGRDQLIALTEDSRPAVKLDAALVVKDFAPLATKRALLDLRGGDGWIAQRANEMLGLIFEEYFDEVWGRPPDPASSDRAAETLRRARRQLGLPEPGTPEHPTYGITRTN
jgi:hypothetical protein